MPLNIYGERLLFRVFLSKMIHASRNQHQRAEITSCLAVVTIQPSRRPLSSALNELRIEGQSKPVSDSMRRLIPVQATALLRPIIPLPPDQLLLTVRGEEKLYARPPAPLSVCIAPSRGRPSRGLFCRERSRCRHSGGPVH